jgi:hypothetical protein
MMKASPSRSDRPHSGQCPDRNQLYQFDTGNLSAREAERLSEHVAGCEKCSALLSDG